MPAFERATLRTTDPATARAFYDLILGVRGDAIVALPAAAVARGATPHWLGQIGVAEVEAVAAAFCAGGAVRLGSLDDGAAVLRDPGGAVVGLAPPGGARTVGIGWHQLHAREPARVLDIYMALFGWQSLAPVELGVDQGVHLRFTWRADGAAVGAVGDVASRPGVHTHWLFFFDVDDLDGAIARVIAAGGRVSGPTTAPSGERFAVCDDPQGAAFGLRAAG